MSKTEKRLAGDRRCGRILFCSKTPPFAARDRRWPFISAFEKAVFGGT